MLNGQVIFVAEDEPYIALDLALAVEDAGGVVLGPAASVEEALALLKTGPVAGAILDVNLGDQDITPVAVFLVERGVPIILQTGIGLPPALADRFTNLIVHIKPCVPARLVEELASLCQTKCPDR